MSNKSKKAIKIGAVTILVTASIGIIAGCKLYKNSSKKFVNDLEKNGISISSTSQIGTLDIESKKSEFSFVQCGNHKSSLSDYEKKILTNDEIPTGIIIETCATNYAQIYMDVDYAKSIVSEFHVEAPICLNIDKMFEDESIDICDINLIVSAFVDKMEANSCLVKVIGHDSNMKRLQTEKLRAEQAFETVERTYSIGLIVDDKFEEVSCNYDMVFGKKYIYSDKDYKTFIGVDYNNQALFYDDYVYIARFDTNVTNISYATGFSEANIMEYNDLASEEVLINERVNIPSKYHAPYWLGVDLSEYQGDIDFQVLSSTIDFAILRVGYTDELTDYMPQSADTHFNHNAYACNSLNIPIGAYYYTSATTESDVYKELNILLKQLEGHNINLPIYIDIGGEALENLESENEYIAEEQKNIIRLYCEKISEAGYIPGIYINNEKIYLVSDFVDVYPIWARGGYAYDEEQEFKSMYIQNDLQQGVKMFQTCQYGTVPGIDGYANLNYADGNYMNDLLGIDVKVKTIN